MDEFDKMKEIVEFLQEEADKSKDQDKYLEYAEDLKQIYKHLVKLYYMVYDHQTADMPVAGVRGYLQGTEYIYMMESDFKDKSRYLQFLQFFKCKN